MRHSMWDRVYQVCVVVEDMDKAVKHYETLGIGPFIQGVSRSSVIRQVHGEDDVGGKVLGRVATLGPIELELLQPVAGNTIQHEFLQNHGEGVMCICAHTDNLQADIEDMKDKGHEVISYVKFDDDDELAYFDTSEVGGLVLVLYQNQLTEK